MLQNVFRWYNGAIFDDIPVLTDNIFQGWFGSGMLHYAVDSVLALVRRWEIGVIVYVRRGYRYI